MKPARRARLRPIGLVSRALDALGILDPAVRLRGGRYIMAYHRVLTPEQARDEWCHPAIWIRPETFDAHLRFFSRVGRIVPLTELLESPDRGRPLFSITFDDAWIDNLCNAVPILDAHRANACFFVPTDAVTTGRLFWTEELARKLGDALMGPRGAEIVAHMGWPAANAGNPDELLPPLMEYIERLKELPVTDRSQAIESLYARFGISPEKLDGSVMTWDQIRTLANQGHLIGSHSKTHLILRDIDAATVDTELVESRRIIEHEIGRPVPYFCFPNARYDAVSSERVLATGYTHGFRIHNLMAKHSDHKALVPRFSASEANSAPPLLKLRLVRAGLQ